MKKHLGVIILICVIANAGFGQVQRPNQQKLAQTGFKFLTITTDARAGAMGEAYTSLQSVSAAMFFNPAGMARLDGLANLSFGKVNWIADIDYTFGSAAFRPFDGRWGVFGFTVVAVEYGQFIGTIRANNESGYEETGNFSPNAFALGLGYAKALSDKFSVGGNLKFVKQELGSAITAWLRMAAKRRRIIPKASRPLISAFSIAPALRAWISAWRCAIFPKKLSTSKKAFNCRSRLKSACR